MRPKIRYDLLLKSQKFASRFNHPIQLGLYKMAYKYIEEMRTDVLKPFTNICIHGNFPQLIIPAIQERQKQKCKIWVHSHLSTPQLSKFHVSPINAETPFNATSNEQNFDLIISCLEAHHYEPTKLMQSYVRRLKPDGAVIGCCLAQNTFKELRWAYMMAQNERSGGMSPKVSAFPGLGEIGHSMTTSQLKLSTILVRDYLVSVESVVDILSLLQMMGESGTLQGKRKGVFKDVLLAACALYDSQFIEETENEEKQKYVNFSLELGLFIGWKEHESQPKPLSRRQVLNNSFFAELIKNDKQAKIYRINEGSDEPEEIDPSQIQCKQNQKDPQQ